MVTLTSEEGEAAVTIKLEGKVWVGLEDGLQGFLNDLRVSHSIQAGHKLQICDTQM